MTQRVAMTPTLTLTLTPTLILNLTLPLTLTLTQTLPQEIAAISRVLDEQRLAGSCELIFVVGRYGEIYGDMGRYREV